MTVLWEGLDLTPAQRFRVEVTDDGSAPCFLAQFSDKPCDGLIRACHLISARRIKDHFPLGAWRWPEKPWVPVTRSDELLGFEDATEVKTVDELVYDPRIGVSGCGGPMGNSGHHGALDVARTLKVPREALPEGVTEYAREFGLTWFVDLEYPTTPEKG